MHMLLNRAEVIPNLHVSDIMRPGVVKIRPDTSARQAAAQLAYYDLTRAPVVGRDGRLAGVVSVHDILHLRTRKAEADDGAIEGILDDYRVDEIMLPVLFSVEPTTSLADLAYLFERTGTDSVPVVEGGQLLGMVRTVDLLRALIASAPA
jgi:CBS domain-containing protein